MNETDKKLDLILEKLAVSKLDGSFLLGFSFLSVLFSLSTLLLTEPLYRGILIIGAILYFLFSFYVGYFRGAIRDNWGFRVWGWLWMSLSTAVITASLIVLLMLENGKRFSPLFPCGLFLIFSSIASFLLIGFIEGVCATTPTLRNRLISISPVHRHFLSPFIDSAIDRRSSKPTYLALCCFLVIGIFFTILGLSQ